MSTLAQLLPSIHIAPCVPRCSTTGAHLTLQRSGTPCLLQLFDLANAAHRHLLRRLAPGFNAVVQPGAVAVRVGATP